MKPTRRQFLHSVSLGGAALILGLPGCGQGVRRLNAGETELAPNQWIRIGADGSITLVAHKSEMGQGVRTALPLILAEELGADWKQVRVVHARPGPQFPRMGTAGSSSVSSSWRPLRLAAAAARDMLIAAAAARWNVEPGDCRAEAGHVIHQPTGRTVGFGSLVGAASALPVPAEPRLKPAAEFRMLGQRIAGIDLPEIITGRAIYAADVRLPGMRFAALARNPTHGRKALQVDDGAARALEGVDRVVSISNGIAVVAANTWTAVRGRDALRIEWEAEPDPAANSAGYWRRLERAIAAGGRRARTAGDMQSTLAGAARRMEAEYRWPFQAHAAIEPLCCVADVRADRCELWVGTQSPNGAQTEVAKLLGIPPERVTINVTLLGGGFGRRLAHDFILEAVEISRAV
ncbi:MAG TPA: molybdopterin cofactor-binding domain-containing protein, partial [Gemmatimonadales bacterium]